jgi:hypothetical protein
MADGRVVPDRNCPGVTAKFVLINAGKGTKVKIAELLSAHAAVADRQIRWRGMEHVTHRTTLAAAGDSLLVQGIYPPKAPSGQSPWCDRDV